MVILATKPVKSHLFLRSARRDRRVEYMYVDARLTPLSAEQNKQRDLPVSDTTMAIWNTLSTPSELLYVYEQRSVAIGSLCW